MKAREGFFIALLVVSIVLNLVVVTNIFTATETIVTQDQEIKQLKAEVDVTADIYNLVKGFMLSIDKQSNYTNKANADMYDAIMQSLENLTKTKVLTIHGGN